MERDTSVRGKAKVHHPSNIRSLSVTCIIHPHYEERKEARTIVSQEHTSIPSLRRKSSPDVNYTSRGRRPRVGQITGERSRSTSTIRGTFAPVLQSWSALFHGFFFGLFGLQIRPVG